MFMNDKKRFEFLEHTADAYIGAYGKNLEEAFENAALALFEVMTNAETIHPTVEDQVEVEALDDKALLYNWLETLLIRFELQGMFYSKFKISTLNETSTGLKLKAKIWGEKYNPRKHLQKVGVKAVTYHRMEILRNPNEVILRFILDI